MNNNNPKYRKYKTAWANKDRNSKRLIEIKEAVDIISPHFTKIKRLTKSVKVGVKNKNL